jgi:hypothetical protein
MDGVKYMRVRRTPVSCGCQELYELFMPEGKATLAAMLVSKYKMWGERTRPSADTSVNWMWERDMGFYDGKIYAGETIFFSDADANKNGKKLVELIQKYNLGEVVSLGGVNPNTKSRITTYLWRYNGNKIVERKVVRSAAVKSVARGKAK